MFEYLNDIDFLTKLDSSNLKVHYARIILLDFQEKPIKEIQGRITAGNLNVNGSSAVRRTLNLTMAASKDNADIENLDNEISINKKVKILIGYDNPYKEDYPDDIIWFKIGIYILTSAQITRNTSGWNITIAGKDKMAKLDGTAGGTIPGPLVANEELIYDDEDKDFYTKEYPTIRKIIYEAVSHFGGEDPANIYISDVDEVIKMLVRYKGEEPIYFDDEFTSFRFYKNSAFTI